VVPGLKLRVYTISQPLHQPIFCVC
jgi:hypothetical protein